MRKILKIALIAILTPILGVLLFLIAVIKTSGVDRLLTEYPYYDQTKKDYVIGKVRPPDWVEAHEVSKYARWAIIVSEDWAFYEHPGVDLNQLEIALKESVQAGEFTRGASTITQQVIKNTVLSDERTLWRKIQEIILALYLERVADKDRILGIYLNIIELGDGVYGISQGADFYFGKRPSQLNAREGAFLAMLLPSPVKYSVSFYKKELTEFASAQVDSILVKLRQADVYDEQERLRQSKLKFYWEKDFYQSDEGDSSEDSPPDYESYLEDSDSFL